MDGRRAATSSTWAKALHAGRPIAPPRVGYSAGKAVSEKRASSPAEQALRALASSAGGIAWLAKSLDQRSPSAPGHAPFASHADVSGLRSCFSPASAQYAQARRSPDAGSTAGERSRPKSPRRYVYSPSIPSRRNANIRCNASCFFSRPTPVATPESARFDVQTLLGRAQHVLGESPGLFQIEGRPVGPRARFRGNPRNSQPHTEPSPETIR